MSFRFVRGVDVPPSQGSGVSMQERSQTRGWTIKSPFGSLKCLCQFHMMDRLFYGLTTAV